MHLLYECGLGFCLNLVSYFFVSTSEKILTACNSLFIGKNIMCLLNILCNLGDPAVVTTFVV